LGSFSNFGARDLFGNYSSRLENIEFNYLHPISDRFEFVAGFRTLQVHDVLSYHVVFPAFSADYKWNDTNYLYGGQLGLNFNLDERDCPFSLNCRLETGVYNNYAANNFSLTSSTGGQIPGGGSASQADFVGDINVTAAYHFGEHVAIRGGYELLWVEGLALASKQAAIATANHTQNAISTAGHLFYNGATFGLDLTW
jgi:hypothetical protein